MRIGAPVHRSTQSPNRTAVRAGRGQRPPRPASRPRSTIRPGRRYADRSAQSHLRPAPGAGARAADLSAPLIPLTLRAMLRTPHPQGPSLGRPAVALVSVLALLAFTCFPVLAQAETVYTPESTTLPGGGAGKTPAQHMNPDKPESSKKAHASETPDTGGTEQ